jgi:hypothetical protein
MVERGLEEVVPGFVLEGLMCGVSALHANESSMRQANWREGGDENSPRIAGFADRKVGRSQDVRINRAKAC